ncbi:hypothetical protein SAMN04488065_1033 [Haloplanus vescus]|uniref:C2H2-type domain-containing protein n=1 Tax=Haloplanus vescus TaxID=555874 RepID=A0A1H3WRK5_9EURY|nr:hypothetical protein [Haloplanus vescus]SDZ89012.1 hypothetical protein SAMN04488065_1033 [Haloplanus vescus]
MRECRYCGETFDDEGAHDDHLKAEHADELGPIDRRRLSVDDDEGRVSLRMVALGVVVLLAGVVVVYATLMGSEGASRPIEPTDVGAVHYHGTINVTIGNQSVDFSQQRFQYESTNVDAFHFEGGDGSEWHVHARSVTLQWAMATIGLEVTDETVTADGETYGDDPDETAIVEVNGSPVEPSTYILQEGDHIRIVAR